MEFFIIIFQAWKVMEFEHGSWKDIENVTFHAKTFLTVSVQTAGCTADEWMINGYKPSKRSCTLI